MRSISRSRRASSSPCRAFRLGQRLGLRLIAGFEQPTSGRIEIFGEAVEGVPPYRRNVTTVFQDHALFPHMNVRENVEFADAAQGRQGRTGSRGRGGARAGQARRLR